MTISRDVLKLEQADLDALMDVVSAKNRALVAAWTITYDQVSTELLTALDELTAANTAGTVTRTQLLRNQRLMAALQAVEDALDVLARTTSLTIGTGLREQIAAAVDAQVGMVAAQLPAQLGATFTPLATSVVAASPEQVAAMVVRVTQSITKQTYQLSTDAKRAIRIQLLRSISVGDNPRVAARKAMQGIEDQWDGGLTRALTIARTEQIDAHRAAAQVVHDQNADVLAGWTWVAHLGPRTCKGCIAMHGREFPLEQAGPEGHQNCRCARVPRTKTWAELGFAGIKDRAPAIKDREVWFNGLPEADQHAILGKTGFAAWKAGKYPMSSWVKKQTNDGWRASWTPTRAPKAA